MKPFKAIPVAPGRNPVLGHLLPLTRDPLGFLRSAPQEQGLLRVRIGFADAVLVCSPSLVDQVLRDDRTFDKGGMLFERGREVLGNGVGSCPHAQHRRQRRLIQPAFQQDRMPGYSKIMTDCIVEAMESWQDGKEIDVFTELVGVTTRILLLSLFSDSLSAPQAREMGEDAGTIFKGFYWRMFMPPPLDKLPTPGNRRYLRARARLNRTARTIISERRRHRVDQGDLLSVMLSSRDGQASKGLSDDEITDQVITFLMAGTEATAGAVSWTLYLLAHNPRYLHQVYAEVDALPQVPRLQDLPSLTTLSDIINESLRVYSPGWISSRATSAPTSLDGFEIPKGVTVIYSPYLIHHRGTLYREPEEFNPHRWERNGNSTPPDRRTFIPFGAGARKCIGDRFAFIEVSLLVATILSKWRLKEENPSRAHPKVGTILTPTGLRMRLEDRGMSPERSPCSQPS